MDTKFINRYKERSNQKLIVIAQTWCNKFVRKRDQFQDCISCDSSTFTDAGHFYSAGHYSAVRFDKDNIHGQCSRCNRDLHGNGNEYRRRIIHRIGAKRLEELDLKVDMYKRTGFKFDKMTLIQTIYDYQIDYKALD